MTKIISLFSIVGVIIGLFSQDAFAEPLFMRRYLPDVRVDVSQISGTGLQNIFEAFEQLESLRPPEAGTVLENMTANRLIIVPGDEFELKEVDRVDFENDETRGVSRIQVHRLMIPAHLLKLDSKENIAELATLLKTAFPDKIVRSHDAEDRQAEWYGRLIREGRISPPPAPSGRWEAMPTRLSILRQHAKNAWDRKDLRSRGSAALCENLFAL